MSIRRPLTTEERKRRRIKAIRRKKDPVYKRVVRKVKTFCRYGLLFSAVFLVNLFYPLRISVPPVPIPAREEGEMRVHFINVEQGDATLFEFPDGDCILFDTGDGDFEHDEHLRRYIQGVSPTSYSIVVSHDDRDHIGGIDSLLWHYPPDEIYLPTPSPFTLDTDVPIYRYSRYDVITASGGAYAVCLSPYSMEEKIDNNSSGVFYVSCYDTVFLMTGDISSSREHRLMRDYALDETMFDSGDYRVRLEDVDVLKVAHHGSGGSSAEDWLSLITPEVAVISSGIDNLYGHPAAGSVARLSEFAHIYRTDQFGDIMISVKPDGYTVLV